MAPCPEFRERENANEAEIRECLLRGHRWMLQSWHHPFPWCWAKCERCGLAEQVPLEQVEGAP